MLSLKNSNFPYWFIYLHVLSEGPSASLFNCDSTTLSLSLYVMRSTPATRRKDWLFFNLMIPISLTGEKFLIVSYERVWSFTIQLNVNELTKYKSISVEYLVNVCFTICFQTVLNLWLSTLVSSCRSKAYVNDSVSTWVRHTKINSDQLLLTALFKIKSL